MVNDFPYFLAQVFTLELIVLLSNDNNQYFERENKHDNHIVDYEDKYDKDQYESHNVAHVTTQVITKHE